MLSIPQRIRDAMTTPGNAGAVKVGIQPYGWPAASDFVSLEPFNWKPTDEITDLYCPVQACSPSDGSLVVLDSDIRFWKPDAPPLKYYGTYRNSIKDIRITNGGSGYTSAPTVTIADSGGAGATATCNIVGGVITSITVNSGGSGYYYVPLTTIDYTTDGGSYKTVASEMVVVTVSGGAVATITPTSALTSITGVVTATITIGGYGASAYAEVSGGAVTRIKIYNGGYCYNDIPLPTISFSGGGGSNAAAVVDSLYSSNYVYTPISLNDITVVVGSAHGLEIQITTAGAQDKFKWRNAGGAWSAEINCALTNTLVDDAIVKFGAITGHTLNSVWMLPVASTTAYYISGDLDDIAISGTPTKATGITYTFKITTAGAQDKFKWLKNGDTGDTTEGVWSDEINVPTTPTLIDGQVSVSWNAITGHAVNDYWVTTICPDYGNYKLRRYTDSGSGKYVPTAETPITITALAAYRSKDSSFPTNHTTILTAAHLISVSANPNSASVILVAPQISGGLRKIQYKLSTDYGATFGAWTDLYSDADYQVQGNISIGMNDDGDIGVLAYYGDHLIANTHTNKSVCLTRTSGSWATGSILALASTDKQVAYDVDIGWHLWAIGSLIGFDGTTTTVDTTPSISTLNELQTYIQDSRVNYVYQPPVAEQFGGMLINNYSGNGGFYGQTPSKLEWLMTPTLTMINRNQNSDTIPSSGWWINPSEDYFILLNSYYCYMIYKDGVDAVLKSTHYYFNTVRACVLAFNSNWIFQIRDHYIYYSNHPAEWTPPTAGTGAGTEIEFTNGASDRVLHCSPYISERQGSCYIVFNNHDGYFNTLTGSLAAITKGSRVNISSGYWVDGTAETMVSKRFFIESYGYTRKDNLPLFWIKCYDANWLLANYRFNRPVEWNETIETGVTNNEYTIYEMLGKIAQAIGGTISYRSRSTAMTTKYPHIKINAGDTAFQHWYNLMSMVPDKTVWDGNDPCIIYPLATDTPNENYRFPQELVKVGGFNKFAFNAANFNATQDEYYLTIWNPSFPTDVLRVNRVYVTGIDENNLTVTGEATDGELPEILDVQNNIAITKGITAEDVAASLLSNYRLTENRGGFMSSPHPGLEIWDVIDVVDTGCNQFGNLRIAALQFSYQSALLGTYQFDQTIQLTSV